MDADGEIIEPLPEYQHHYCSFDCLQRWAFAKAFTLDSQPEDTTT